MCTSDFIMEIKEIDRQNPRGFMATGIIKKGKVFLGDFLEIVGINNILKTHIAFIEKINNDSEDKNSLIISNSAQCGENVRLLLTNSRNDAICVGQIISTPKKIRPHKKFVAEISLLNNITFCLSEDYSFNANISFSEISEATATFCLLDNMQNSISSFCVTIEMDVPLAIGVNLNFEIYKWNEKIGVGNVVKIIE